MEGKRERGKEEVGTSKFKLIQHQRDGKGQDRTGQEDSLIPIHCLSSFANRTSKQPMPDRCLPNDPAFRGERQFMIMLKDPIRWSPHTLKITTCVLPPHFPSGSWIMDVPPPSFPFSFSLSLSRFPFCRSWRATRAVLQRVAIERARGWRASPPRHREPSLNPIVLFGRDAEKRQVRLQRRIRVRYACPPLWDMWM